MSAGRVVLALSVGIGLIAAELRSQAPSLAERQREGAARKASWRTSLSSEEIRKFDGGDVHSVHFFTRHVGWAVGRGTATMLLKTTDGGKTWERFPIMDGASHGSIFNAIRFWDVNHGWIAGSNGLLRTTDGDESWEPVTGANFDANVLLPLSPEVVMIAAGRQIWLTSTDGSSAAQIGTVDARDGLTGLAFVAPNTFYATHGGTHGSVGSIHRSTDGGATWEPVVQGDKPILGIAFRDARRGVAVGVGVAYYTNDGGDTWKRVMATGTRYTAAYIDDNTIVSPGTAPGIAISRDGGKTWRPHSGPPTQYNLVDIAAVDGGWWFVAGGYGATAIYQFIDPEFVDEIARSSIPIPATIKLPGGRRLPSGMYDVTLAHRGERHIVTLERTGAAPIDSSGAAGGEPATDTTAPAPPGAPGDAPPKCDPCDATVPVEVEYAVEELTPETTNRSRLRFSLEPTASGVAIVIDVAINPPRDAAITLAALGVKQEQEVDAVTTVRKAGEATRKEGGLRDRLKKARDGDIRGAATDVAVNPQAVANRVKSAKTTPTAMYRIKVRYPIEIFPRRRAAAPDGGGTQ